VSNTEKLDDIRRRLRVIEARLNVIQRVNVIVFERVTGGAFPPGWVVAPNEQRILADADTMSMTSSGSRRGPGTGEAEDRFPVRS
jgi:hypothetical protein